MANPRENRRNYYRLLQVQPDAPVEIIRASYRALMQKLRHHPDLGGDAWQAQLLNEAYATLTDSGRRRAYDRTLDLRTVARGPAARSNPARAESARDASRQGFAAATTSRWRSRAQASAPHEDAERGGTSAHRRAQDRWAAPATPAANTAPRGSARHLQSYIDHARLDARSVACAFCGALNAVDSTAGTHSRPQTAGLEPRYRGQQDCSRCASPLDAAADSGETSGTLHDPAAGGSADEGVVVVHVDWPTTRSYRARVLELSPARVVLLSPVDLVPGRRLKLSSAAFRGVGRVERCRPDGATSYRVDVRFLTVRFDGSRPFLSFRA